MAHDSSYGAYGAADQTPYPHNVDYNYAQIPDERYYQPQNLAPPYQQSEVPYRSSSRSRASSSAHHDPSSSHSYPPPPVHPTSPTIYNAVNSAFDNSTAANQLPEEVINKITEQVRSEILDKLRAEGLSTFQQHPPHPPQPVFAAPQPQPYIPTSPISSSTNASRPVHTPPSPARRSSNGSSLADHDAHHRHDVREAGEGSRELHREHTREDLSSRTAVREREGHRDGVRDSGRIDLSQRTGDRSEEERSRTRPPPTRSMTGEEETVIEKMWQPLFDSEGQPTARLGQFLRGLALHLVSRLATNYGGGPN
jgi:hypothetical protein